MRRGTDHFHPPFPRPLIGIAPHEGRQKSVVDIDDTGRETADEFIG